MAVKDTSAPERVQASFRQLSDSAATLNSVSDELRKTISELEAALRKLNLGVSAWVDISKGTDESGYGYWSRQLGYTRFGKEWCIALRTVEGHEAWSQDDIEEWKFNDSPRWMRIEGVGRIPELLDALNKQAEDTTEKIQKKTEEAKTLTAAISAAFPRPGELPPPPKRSTLPPPPSSK